MQFTQPNRHWYANETFWHHITTSDYVTAFTDWFMTFIGKCAELALYATVLYSCAELYPGVHLPSNLSLTMFLVQMGALDIGGLSLGKMAKQARNEGNLAGARSAARLSRWLIAIVLLGVVTVGIERVVALPEQVHVSIEMILVVARAICSVFYGKVVHDLKGDLPLFASAKQGQIGDEVVAKMGQLERLIGQVSEQQKVQKIVVVPEKKEPVKIATWEQFVYPNLPEIVPVFDEKSVWKFVEFGAMSIIDEAACEAEEEVQSSPQNVQHLEALLAPQNQPTKGPYVMTFEEASEYTGVSIRTLKNKAKDGEIETSMTGKVKVKSLEKLKRKG